MTSNEDIASVVEANFNFGYSVYKKLRKASLEESPNIPENILFSPLSVKIMLALAFVGAKGATAEEMSTVLQLSHDPSQVSNNFLDLISQLKSSNVILTIANKIFIDNKVKLSDKFQQTAIKYIDSETEYVDMKKKASLGKINSCVAQKTEKKIASVLENLDADTEIVLVNTLYFNGKWAKEFEATNPMQFYLTPEESIEVPAIHCKDYYTYYEDRGVKILEIPYKGEEYSLVITLPEDTNELPTLEDIFPSDYQNKQKSEVEIDVTIPKFKIESFTDFTTLLQEMGMETAFSNEADFTGLIDPESSIKNIAISKVVQKCCMDVNEEGTEAAVSTAIKFSKLNSPELEPSKTS
ncbi:serpin B6-like [Chrysoperla carnea]|uniref:serpin B6-like n=1 Tax=Chrysoperla carnea TaxID=189513 RepID=UPI001D08AE32|nr:serpin B6-like [Chrysoperla carnea]